VVVLHGRCQELAAELGIDQWWVSISHISTHATASAIGVARQ
jgi:holo-[acyl-carrier protein] synthase